MLFNSLEFAIFFPVVVLIYFSIPHKYRWMHLLASSCIFYMWLIPIYIFVLAFTIVVDYFAGILIEGADGNARKRYLALSLVVNIGTLAAFKYINLIDQSLAGIAPIFGWKHAIHDWSIVLPVGLSFHTFQAMSYTIDVYRGRQQAERHLGYYALYVMFFPQLVAGPIERAHHILPQFRIEQRFDAARATLGLRLMLWGLFKKIVIADRLSTAVNAVFDNPYRFQGMPLLLGAVFFSFQIYCDFSGYSDIARGAAKVFGIELMENFNTPYFARSLVDFWRRWHISLSTWFRDYLYFPLALSGRRVSKARTCASIMLVFAVSGMWHGADWKYLLWGAVHGTLVTIGFLMPAAAPAWARKAGWDQLPGVVRTGCQMLFTYLLVTLAWVLFRARGLLDSAYILKTIFVGVWAPTAGMSFSIFSGVHWAECLLIGLLLAIEGLQAWRPRLLDLGRFPVFARWACYEAGVLSIFYLSDFHVQQFIYFRF